MNPGGNSGFPVAKVAPPHISPHARRKGRCSRDSSHLCHRRPPLPPLGETGMSARRRPLSLDRTAVLERSAAALLDLRRRLLLADEGAALR
jgi:hypothetical protein